MIGRRIPPVLRGLLAVLVFTASAIARADDPGVSSSAELLSANGTEVYGHICQGCHMGDGKGALGAGRYPSLAGDPALVSWQFVALTILQGRNAMPPFGHASGGGGPFSVPHLTDEQIAAVVNYVRSHFGNHYGDRITPQQVAALPHLASPPQKR
jgi:mono/diheme cytochrome c family protein